MDHFTQVSTVRLRAGALWSAATLLLLGLAQLGGPLAWAVAAAPGPDFVTLLVQGCALAALLAGGWLWLLTTWVVVTVAARPDAPARRVGPVRLALLAACGVAAVSTTAPAAAAPEGPEAPQLPAQSLAGLPLPDRATGGAPGRHPQPAVVTVRTGDSLWTIAARQLGPAGDPADVATYWRRVHSLNAAVIGPDPHLVLPGQQLTLPPV